MRSITSTLIFLYAILLLGFSDKEGLNTITDAQAQSWVKESTEAHPNDTTKQSRKGAMVASSEDSPATDSTTPMSGVPKELQKLLAALPKEERPSNACCTGVANGDAICCNDNCSLTQCANNGTCCSSGACPTPCGPNLTCCPPMKCSSNDRGTQNKCCMTTETPCFGNCCAAGQTCDPIRKRCVRSLCNSRVERDCGDGKCCPLGQVCTGFAPKPCCPERPFKVCGGEHNDFVCCKGNQDCAYTEDGHATCETSDCAPGQVFCPVLSEEGAPMAGFCCPGNLTRCLLDDDPGSGGYCCPKSCGEHYGRTGECKHPCCSMENGQCSNQDVIPKGLPVAEVH